MHASQGIAWRCILFSLCAVVLATMSSLHLTTISRTEFPRSFGKFQINDNKDRISDCSASFKPSTNPKKREITVLILSDNGNATVAVYTSKAYAEMLVALLLVDFFQCS